MRNTVLLVKRRKGDNSANVSIKILSPKAKEDGNDWFPDLSSSRSAGDRSHEDQQSVTEETGAKPVLEINTEYGLSMTIRNVLSSNQKYSNIEIYSFLPSNSPGLLAIPFRCTVTAFDPDAVITPDFSEKEPSLQVKESSIKVKESSIKVKESSIKVKEPSMQEKEPTTLEKEETVSSLTELEFKKKKQYSSIYGLIPSFANILLARAKESSEDDDSEDTEEENSNDVSSSTLRKAVLALNRKYSQGSPSTVDMEYELAMQEETIVGKGTKLQEPSVIRFPLMDAVDYKNTRNVRYTEREIEPKPDIESKEVEKKPAEAETEHEEVEKENKEVESEETVEKENKEVEKEHTVEKYILSTQKMEEEQVLQPHRELTAKESDRTQAPLESYKDHRGDSILDVEGSHYIPEDIMENKNHLSNLIAEANGDENSLAAVPSAEDQNKNKKYNQKNMAENVDKFQPDLKEQAPESEMESSRESETRFSANNIKYNENTPEKSKTYPRKILKVRETSPPPPSPQETSISDQELNNDFYIDTTEKRNENVHFEDIFNKGPSIDNKTASERSKTKDGPTNQQVFSTVIYSTEFDVQHKDSKVKKKHSFLRKMLCRISSSKNLPKISSQTQKNDEVQDTDFPSVKLKASVVNEHTEINLSRNDIRRKDKIVHFDSRTKNIERSNEIHTNCNQNIRVLSNKIIKNFDYENNGVELSNSEVEDIVSHLKRQSDINKNIRGTCNKEEKPTISDILNKNEDSFKYPVTISNRKKETNKQAQTKTKSRKIPEINSATTSERKYTKNETSHKNKNYSKTNFKIHNDKTFRHCEGDTGMVQKEKASKKNEKDDFEYNKGGADKTKSKKIRFPLRRSTRQSFNFENSSDIKLNILQNFEASDEVSDSKNIAPT